MLNDAKACAGGPVVSIDTAGFRAGGEVTVIVSCSPLRTDLSLVGPPPTAFSASATATIDLHRAEGLP
jgi:hypothetical protein